MSRLRYISAEVAEYRFPGAHPLERPILYTPEALDSLLKYHRAIAQAFPVENPYFEFADQSQDFLMNQKLGNGISLKVGPVGAFTREQVAAIIQEQTCLYVARGTMGKNFPKDDPQKVAELLAVMMAGFSPQRTVVLFEKETNEGIKPVVGVQAHPGSKDTKLLQTMLNNFVQGNGDRVPSTLSTLSALKFSMINHELVQFLAQYGMITESQTVSMSRLFATTREESQLLDIDIKGYPWLAMAALAIGIAENAKQFSSEQPQPEICLYDTHEEGIQTRLEELFGMHLVERDAVEATEKIKQSILRHHYLSRQHGGYQEDICIGYVTVEEFLQKAIELLIQNQIELPQNYL